MKKKEQKKNLPDIGSATNISEFFRAYFATIKLIHKNLSVFRIIIMYIFIVFAIVCMLFTITVPVTSEYKSPTGWAKTESRLISGGIMVANIIIYGMIMAWRNTKSISGVIRIAFIASVSYLDIFLIGRVVYELIREGMFF